jgi:hypothetical protein
MQYGEQWRVARAQLRNKTTIIPTDLHLSKLCILFQVVSFVIARAPKKASGGTFAADRFWMFAVYIAR